MTDRLSSVALASISPRRRQLLESLDLRVVQVRSAYEETNGVARVGAAELARRHAIGKAEGAEPAGPPVLIAADTIVDVDGALFGKPRDAQDARRMLHALAGRWHVVHTGFALIDRTSGRKTDGVESSSVKFMPLDDEVVERYVATGEPMDKAGAYGIQGKGAVLVERVDGDFYTVMGLPLARLAAALRSLGHTIG